MGPTPRRQPFPAGRAGIAPIDTLELRAHTYFLAHDRLGGRDTGSPGGEIAAIYLASQCRRLGLRPVLQDYFQEVPLLETSLLGGRLRVEEEGTQAGREFVLYEHFVPDFMSGGVPERISAPVVYLEAPPTSLRLPQLRGSVVVTLGPVGGIEALRLLQSRGALAVIQMATDTASFSLYRISRGVTVLHHADPGVESSLLSPIPLFVAGPEITTALIAGALQDPGRLPPDGPLGKRIELEFRKTERTMTAPNVACVLPGADAQRRDTAIVFTAHYDHLGYGTPDERGDSIYNGFSDDAAGVAMLLAIAQAMTRAPQPPRHSFLFLFFTGEERGLLGSDYYVARPLWPLARTRAVISLDAGAPPGKPVSWRIAGGEGTELGLLAVDVALEMGWSATTSDPRPNGDYYPFHRLGRAAIALIPGPGPFEGLTTDSSNALRRRWDFYHQPGDEWHESFPFSGLERYARYAYLVGLAVDRRDSRLGAR